MITGAAFVVGLLLLALALVARILLLDWWPAAMSFGIVLVGVGWQRRASHDGRRE